MTIPYDYYRTFFYVAKYRSFTRAAKVLLSSQPNVTRSIHLLEHELGCRLFVRSRQGATLTPEGEKLFAHVQIAQEQLQAGEAELLNGKTLHSGVLSIGASEVALHGLLLPVLRDFHLTYPGIHIRISNHSTPQAVRAVKEGAVEFAVVTTPTGICPPMEEKPLLSFEDIVIGGPHFADLANETLSLQSLCGYPLVCLGRETHTYSFYDRLFTAHGQVLQPDIEAATADQILPMVKYDLGLGFLPRFLAQRALDNGEVFEIKLEENIPARNICMVRDKSRPLSTAALELIKNILGKRKFGACG